MTTRRALIAGLAALAAVPAAAHTPYRQWTVYRRSHMLLGCHRGDLDGHATARALADHLAVVLPEARARVARAPAAHRLAGLMATGQMDLAVLLLGEASEMAAGEGQFAPYGPIALGTLAMLADGRALVAHERFLGEHAELVFAALLGSELVPRHRQEAIPPVPWREEVAALLHR